MAKNKQTKKTRLSLNCSRWLWGKSTKKGKREREKRRMGDREREGEKKKKKQEKKKTRQFPSIPADKKRKQPKTQHQRDCSNNQHLYKSQ